MKISRFLSRFICFIIANYFYGQDLDEFDRVIFPTNDFFVNLEDSNCNFELFESEFLIIVVAFLEAMNIILF